MKMKVGRNTVNISNPDKVLFPEIGLTKAGLAEYYRKASKWLLKNIRNRALTLERYPEGIEKDGFIQQEASEYFPDTVDRKVLQRRDGSRLTHILCCKRAGLVYFANLGVVTFHSWLSRIDRPDHPDRMIFDLDPWKDDFSSVKEGAGKLKQLLEEIGLVPFIMITGSKGVHVVVPLDRSSDFDTVRRFAGDVVSILAARYPERMTMEQRKKKRGRRLYLDVFRNGYGQTGVTPYTLRPVARATVATPLEWDELFAVRDARKYTVENIFRRLGRKDDPWKGMGSRARSLKNPRKILDSLRKE